MARYLNLDDAQSFRMRCDEHALDLFDEDAVNGLQVCRLARKEFASGESLLVPIENENVSSFSQLKRLGKYSQDAFQLFFVRQVRSWTTLKISRHLFQDLIDSYGVFLYFWDCAFTFGIKTDENNMEFPSYRARQTKGELGTEFESAYVLRRVELHGRELSEGQEPWSIRQTAVYHKSGSSDESTPVFIAINPSASAERMLRLSMGFALEDLRAVAPFNIHRILITDSLKNWRDYMASLEERLRQQSDQVIMTKVGAEKEDLLHLGDRNVNFTDRQQLKRLEDSIVELEVILGSLLNTVCGVRAQCESSCKTICSKRDTDCDCQILLGEFDSHIGELKVYTKRSQILHEQANGVAQLLADLLSYEDAIALKDLAIESHSESKAMHDLAERSTQDGKAMKILTIIALVYLPTTIVASFFSTEFVHTNDRGDVEISTNVWLLAAVAIPMTVMTVTLWWTWVHWTISRKAKDQEKRLAGLTIASLRSLVKRKRATKDLEMGVTSVEQKRIQNREQSWSTWHDSGYGSRTVTEKSG